MDGYDRAGSYNTQAIFNASQYSNVYKDDCTTVQPPAVKYLYCIQISGESGNAEDITTKIKDKADIDLENVDSNIDFVVKSWRDGVNWYRVYRSGWVEQSGEFGPVNNETIMLHIEMEDTDYTITSAFKNYSDSEGWRYDDESKTVTSFNVSRIGGVNSGGYWKVEGQAKTPITLIEIVPEN